ncbi:ABC transporter A family member 6 [Psilocybe cubensis]|uniref:ABC transporter A family member 6 n=1 Tax=Psilocybe cubensis TaxID=181762 RepID=A0ACB8HGB5_PSICU|nr:ABC transporter A family member 6 [Psilocybe cubensis]KAH9486185.1 ABC transporter A family member 6 [Psilocybe cubensis]
MEKLDSPIETLDSELFNNYGVQGPAEILPLQRQYENQGVFLWADETNGTSNPSPTDIISRITADFTPKQLSMVRRLDTMDDIRQSCPQNFNGLSSCFAGVGFSDSFALDASAPAVFQAIVNYTIFADAGLSYIELTNHGSDFEKRILPLQWALDKAIIELRTGIRQATPMEWPYSNYTNEDQSTRYRLSYIRGIREIIALAFFLCFVGVSYQIPGSVASERALLITSHMKAMGLLDSARILSWHISISLTYLPAWTAVAITWKFLIFIKTSIVLIIFLHILLGLVLASWSFITAAPFSTSPQLAAIISTFLAIIFALLGLVLDINRTAPMVVFAVIFPPSFYIFALKAICGYENHQTAVDVLKGDPDRGIIVLPMLCAAIVNIFLWPYLAVLLERRLHDVHQQTSRRQSHVKLPWAFWGKRTLKEQETELATVTPQVPDNVAFSIRNLSKVYKAWKFFGPKNEVTAVMDLSLDVPKTGIYVMLGSNGAGKSTTLSVVAGLSSISSGSVLFEGGHHRPPRGVMGIVPQKNVLFPELTCLQTLRVWKSVKWSETSEHDEDIEQLLRDCDLGAKINANAATLSGGQKRKLQLAIGLLGGSKIVLVDECTSGVDPLSRRAIWKTMLRFREDRAIIFTTHFLDEADLLADYIAILAPPGKVVASGSPVTLKREFGQGYSVHVSIDISKAEYPSEVTDGILDSIQEIVPQACSSTISPQLVCYHLKTRDANTVTRVLDVLDNAKTLGTISSYDLMGTTIEDVFLNVMNENQVSGKLSLNSSTADTLTEPVEKVSDLTMDLPSGRQVSPFRQAITIFHKRTLIAKRSWLTPLLTVLVAVAGSCIPLLMINGREQSCTPPLGDIVPPTPLYLPNSPLLLTMANKSATDGLYASPPGIVSTLGRSTDVLSVTYLPDYASFQDYTNDRNMSLGGIYINQTTGESTVAWEATAPGYKALTTLNLASNILLNDALNSTGGAASLPSLIQGQYIMFNKLTAATLFYLKWIFFFGAVMAVYPAFSALYVSRERASSVQAMQFSNGLCNPIGLWLGHLMFDTIISTLLSTIIVIVFALVSDQFRGLGYLWLIFFLYGITANLFAYCLSFLVSSPLAAFALVAGYQFVTFILYLTAYMAIFTFAPILKSSRLVTIVHFSTSFISPVTSITRAALVSVNMFSLGCRGTNFAGTRYLLSLTKLGGPILYLVLYAIGLFSILVWLGSGSISLASLRKRPRPRSKASHILSLPSKKIDADEKGSSVSSTSLLEVSGVSKKFKHKSVTDDVNISVERDTIYALLGPNGAGKTTTFNMIRGDISPDAGDVFIDGHSVLHHPRLARLALGVCPQFTAIDSQLTVREHLVIYGRLKGLKWGRELDESVNMILQGTSLHMYADRMANKLSGGNQRKLSLAIALLGNPSVVLIDEFSSGVDPKMKREMWETLRKVSSGKAILITTHSMEEASALANCVGILAKRILAVGTTASLSERYPVYEVHFSCRTREDVVKARSIMAQIPGATMADDVATRFEVPMSSIDSTSEDGSIISINDGRGCSLAKLFGVLSSHDDGSSEYTVEKASLESVFLKVIKENNVKEEDKDRTRKKTWWKCC